jgi:histone deacetylase complex regulatory component SIN3
MNDYEDLRFLCKKFIDKQYNVEELSQTLSRIAVPSALHDIVSDAEYSLEKIRFCVSDNEQYNEALKIVNLILSKIEELEK